jgi:hypothetical protein
LSVTRKLVHFVTAIVLTAFVCGSVVALPPYYPVALRYPDVAFGVFFAGSIFSLPFVGVGGLVIGMPIAFALNSWKVSGAVQWGLAGAIAGGLYSFLIMLAADGLPPNSLDAALMAWLGILPGIVSGVYWWGAVARHEQLESAVV